MEVLRQFVTERQWDRVAHWLEETERGVLNSLVDPTTGSNILHFILQQLRNDNYPIQSTNWIRYVIYLIMGLVHKESWRATNFAGVSATTIASGNESMLRIVHLGSVGVLSFAPSFGGPHHMEEENLNHVNFLYEMEGLGYDIVPEEEEEDEVDVGDDANG